MPAQRGISVRTMREHRAAAIDGPPGPQSHSAAIAMHEPQPSVYVSELSRRGLARRRARIRRRSLPWPRVILLFATVTTVSVAVFERVAG
jgi:hypothetical protein